MLESFSGPVIAYTFFFSTPTAFTMVDSFVDIYVRRWGRKLRSISDIDLEHDADQGTWCPDLVKGWLNFRSTPDRSYLFSEFKKSGFLILTGHCRFRFTFTRERTLFFCAVGSRPD